MPLFVNEEKKSNETKAIKEFTDRVEPRNVFWKNYSLIENAMTSNEKIPIQVVNFYGIGGTGKTRLLEQLRYEMGEKARNAKVCYIDFEKLKGFNGEPAAILNAIKMEMKNKHDYEFPLFELAYYEYKVKLGYDISKPELKNILLKNKELSFLASFIEEIPLVGTFAKIASMVDEGASLLRNRFNDATLKNRLKDIDSISAQEQEDLLSYYFALDFQNNLKKEKCPFVFQIDTYERLVNELTEVGNVNRIDDWLKGKDGLIRNVNNVLWVIAGREKLKWELQDENWKGSLDQHLLGDLSQNDSSSFLRTAGISDEKLIEQLYNLTGGTPIFLDMCVDTYYKLIEKNKPIVIDEFGGDRLKLVERFFTYMNDSERDFVTALAFVENWTDENVENQIKPILGNFSFSLYEKIKQFSFVIQEGTNYKIHETIRDVITEEASELIKNKFNKAKKDIKEDKIKQIEQITVKNIKKEEFISEDNEKSVEEEKQEYVSEIYINSVKREEYRKVIDEMVVEIIDFLYKKPKFTKTNKKLYCDMINDLLVKIEDFCDKYDARYDYKKIESILSYRIFKNTYEYKMLDILNMCLIRSYYCDNSYSYGGESRYISFIKKFNRIKNIYKTGEDKIKPIKYLVKFLADGNKTINMHDVRNNCEFFSSYELNNYINILREYKINGNSIENILLAYSRRDYKKFHGSFKVFLNENKDTNNKYYRRMILRLSLATIYEEFKGKPGTGYTMRDYRLNKEADKLLEKKYSNVVDKNEINKIKKAYVLNSRNEFVSKYLDIASNLIEKDKTLIDEIFLKLCTKACNAIKDKDIQDETKIRLVKLLINLNNEILNSGNINLITEYTKTLFILPEVLYLTSKDFFNNNLAEFQQIFSNVLMVYDNAIQKMKDIYGTHDSRTEELECSYKIELLLNENMIREVLNVYKKYSQESFYSTHRELILEKIYKYIDNMKNSKIKDINSLIELYTLLFDEFSNEIDKYFSNYMDLSEKGQQVIDKKWNILSTFAIELYYRTGDSSYYEKFVNILNSCVKKTKMLPIVNMYQNFSNTIEKIYEACSNPKYNDIVIKSMNILNNVFNLKEFPEFNNKLYLKTMFRKDLALYPTLILSLIAYEKYLTKNECDKIDLSQIKKEFCGYTSYDYFPEKEEWNFMLYAKISSKVISDIYYLNIIYNLILGNYKRSVDRARLKDAIDWYEVIQFDLKSKNKKINHEFITLVNYLYTAVLGIEWPATFDKELNKIVDKHTKGLFKDKDGGELYIRFKNAIETIKLYNRQNKIITLDEINKCI